MTETERFDGRGLFTTLEEIRGLFAELRYIDKGMEYMESEEAGWGERIGQGTEQVDVEFGRTFPFTRTYRVPRDWFNPFGVRGDRNAERVAARLPEIAAEAETWAANNIESVSDRIRPLTWPRGSMYDSDCLQPVTEMHTLLDHKVRTDFGRLAGSIDRWEGRAADNFKSNYYYPFGTTLLSQKHLLGALMGGIASAKAIAESTQHSIVNAVDTTRAAVSEQLRWAQEDAERHRQQSNQQAWIIASGAATVVAAVLTGGVAATSSVTLWAAGFTAAAGGTQIASEVIPVSEPFDIEGSTADELLTSLWHAITQIKENDIRQHEYLQDEIDDALQQVDHLRGGADGEYGQLIPIRPDIVDGVTSETFHQR